MGFERDLSGDILGGLRLEKSGGESGYDPKVTKHANPYAEGVPSGLSSEMRLNRGEGVVVS